MVKVILGRQEAEALAEYLRERAPDELFHDTSGALMADWIEECCGMRKSQTESEEH